MKTKSFRRLDPRGHRSRLLVAAVLVAGVAPGCWFDKFTKVDGDSGSGGSSSASGGMGGEAGSSGGATGSGGQGTGGSDPTAPVALDDTGSTPQNTAVSVDVLDNDTGSGLSLLSAANGEPDLDASLQGSCEVDGARSVRFTPVAEFWGAYRCSYTVEDADGKQATATLTVRVIPSSIALSTLEKGYGGIIIDGAAGDNLSAPSKAGAQDLSRGAVSRAGDVNGDGIEDLILGARGAGGGVGRAVVVLGSKTLPSLKLDQPDIQSFAQIINGAGAGDSAGVSVSGAGRVNGDTFGDVLIGATQDVGTAGRAYVVHGSSLWPAAPITLQGTPMAAVGATINGAGTNRAGQVVAGGDDLDGDGKPDLLVLSNAGSRTVYAVTDIKNGTLPAAASHSFTTSLGVLPQVVAFAGDMFGPGTDTSDGKSEVISAVANKIVLLRGGASFPSDETGIDATNGFTTSTLTSGAYSVAAAGEFDGTAGRDVAYCTGATTCTIVPWAPADMFDLDTGYVVTNLPTAPKISGGGDIDDDGFDDIVIASTSKAYVIWGKNSPAASVNATSLGAAGVTIDPGAVVLHDAVVIGDINDDGKADLAVTSPSANSGAGRVYVIFGF